jgi:hypothetical protein
MPRRKPKSKGGRPCRYTPRVVTTFMATLARGQSLADAADTTGIGTMTLYRWLALSRAGDARNAGPTPIETYDRPTRRALARIGPDGAGTDHAIRLDAGTFASQNPGLWTKS